MTFSLSLLLYPYLAFLAVWLFFMLTGVYHMLKFGLKSVLTVVMTILFVLVGAGLLSVSLGYISQIDWQKQVSIFGTGNNSVENME